MYFQLRISFQPRAVLNREQGISRHINIFFLDVQCESLVFSRDKYKIMHLHSRSISIPLFLKNSAKVDLLQSFRSTSYL